MGLLTIIEQGSSCEENDQWERSGEINYYVAYTSDMRTPAVKINLSTQVGFGISYTDPDDAGLVLMNVRVERDFDSGICAFDNPNNSADPNKGTLCYWYNVTCSYGPWDPFQHTATGDPVDQPITKAFLWTIDEQPCDVAITGHNSDGSYIFSPVLNSANCPFDPGITRDKLRCTIKISQNVLTYNPADFFNMGGVINNDTNPLWNGFPQNTLKWTPPNMPAQGYSQVVGNYYRLDHEFNFDPDGFNAQPIDRGYSALGPSGYPEKILDYMGQPVSEPVLLDGNGNRLLNPTPDNIKTFNFQRTGDINFVNFFGAKFQNLFM